MFCRLLGPLEILVHGSPLPVGRNRQLTVIACLALEANRAVSARSLVEAVWSGTPPRTAEEQIQTSVWRLRKAFRTAGAPANVIETTSLGYKLRIDEAQTDVAEFDRLVTRARSIAAAGEHARAVDDYTAALNLFRGPVLAELSSPVVASVAAQWEERRLVALEEAVELELKLGKYREVVGKLRRLVAQFPLREGLRCLLMTALHGSGRRAEALAVFRDGRNVLVEQLGLEPGRRLQEVHREVLSGKERMAATADVTALVRAPAQLTADISDFTGRADVVDGIVRDLRGDEAHRITVVVGKCGTGKTTLAVHAAHLTRRGFPDGQLYADLGGTRTEPTDPAEILRQFLHALGVPDQAIPRDVREAASVYRSLLATRRMLVLLDDAEGAEQMRPLLPGTGSSAVLVTSRSNLTELPGAHLVELGPLPPGEALELLRGIAGPTSTADQAAAKEIVAATGGLPLAVRAAGARLRARPQLRLVHLAHRLRIPAVRLDELTHGGLDLRSRIAGSEHRLGDDATALWYRLGLLDVPDFPFWIGSPLLDVGTTASEKLLDELVYRRVLEVDGEDALGGVRYRMDELTRLYARDRAVELMPTTARRTAVRRAAESWRWLSALARTDKRVDPSQSRAAVGDDVVETVMANPVGWLRAERTAVKWAEKCDARTVAVLAS
ncbi:AfsR/SARP family transcriptional regulator [Actinocrispum wychmicini]|uniref:DNA-binding SARP family transcriptional activator n=1 Tax=Actinocrispum wychmicini TaxID=1213861 RepID=A0A4R2JDC3_9PSEU|nr:AfsR/SARP family transcriptional regulator [Actinocrispum wychmicini]TCO56092.1 DNA-binding SARP family transcriptional activator [Actinocrispum wychmicini]